MHTLSAKTGKRYRNFNCCNEKGLNMEEKVVGYVRVSTENFLTITTKLTKYKFKAIAC